MDVDESWSYSQGKLVEKVEESWSYSQGKLIGKSRNKSESQVKLIAYLCIYASLTLIPFSSLTR